MRVKQFCRVLLLGALCVAQIGAIVVVNGFMNSTNEDVLIPLFLATLTGPAFLAVWMALGQLAFSIRAPRALILLALWSLSSSVDQSRVALVQLVFGAAVFFATLVSLSLLRMVFGWRLVDMTVNDSQPNESAVRLSVRELLLQTAGFAAVFAIIKANDALDLPWNDLAADNILRKLAAMIAVASMLIVPSGVGAILAGDDRLTYRIALCALTAAATGAFGWVFTSPPRIDALPLVFGQVAFTVALVSCLLLIRGAGFRLARKCDRALTAPAWGNAE